MRPAIGKQLINGIVIAIVSVIVIVVLSIWQYQRIQDTGVVIKHTNQVLYQTEQVLNATVQYELNVKNYLLTGDSVFLQTAADLLSLLPGKIGELKTLTVDNPVQQQRIDSLSRYADKDRATLQQAMRPSQSGNFEGAAALIRAEATSGYSYQIQSVIARVEAEERRLLDQRRRSGQVKALQLQVVLWSLIAAVAVLAIVVFRKVRIDLGREQLAREQLSHFNQELEKEVQAQTASLQASEDKYKTLFYKSPLPKWIYDERTMHFLEVNETAIRMYGYSQEEFRNMTIMDIRPPEDRERLVLDVEEVRRDPAAAGGLPQATPVRESQWRHVKKNGEAIDVDVIAHPIEFGGRRARMVVVNDITDRKRYEGKLQRLNGDLARRASELAASNAELERFAYIASHDLQEPLRMVSSFLQLLQKKYSGQLDAKADQYIHYAVDGAERMKALIMDLLEYSRVGTGKEGFGWVETAAVMAEVGETFREKIVAARARVEIGAMPRVWGDKVQLTQLLQNLVSNALKYHSDEPPLIRIGAVEETDPAERAGGAGEGVGLAAERELVSGAGERVGPGHWRFSVADNGIGIDPLFFDKIFIIFQRLHNKTDYSGTGIGLAICKKIVERHGGKIWVESGQQQGSTFFFTINKKT